MGHNSQVLDMYSNIAKQYGLTLDQFLQEIKDGQIKVVREGWAFTFERSEPVFELSGACVATRQKRVGRSR